MGHQAPSSDRSVGVPGIGHGDRFADIRARSKAFDEARVRIKARKKKPREKIQASDFVVGEEGRRRLRPNDTLGPAPPDTPARRRERNVNLLDPRYTRRPI